MLSKPVKVGNCERSSHYIASVLFKVSNKTDCNQEAVEDYLEIMDLLTS